MPVYISTNNTGEANQNNARGKSLVPVRTRSGCQNRAKIDSAVFLSNDSHYGHSQNVSADSQFEKHLSLQSEEN